MPPSRLIEYIPPEAVYHRVPLDDDKNALGPWSEAINHLNYPDAEDDDDDIIFFELLYGSDETGERVDYPTGKKAERIATILENNRRAIELIDEGIKRGRLQFPEPRPETFLADKDVARDFVHIAQVRHVKIRSLLAAGEIRAACEEAVRLLRTGEMICTGEGLIFQYIMGCWPRNTGANAIHRLASEDEIPDDSLADLLTAVRRSLQREDGFIQSLRVDLCRGTLPILEQMPEATDVVTLVDQLLALYYSDQIFTDLMSVEDEDKVDPKVLSERLRWRREKILFLLDGHPDPFDKIATAELMGRLFAAMIRKIERSAKSNATDQDEGLDDPLDAVLGRIKIWPEQLTPGFWCDCLGEDEQARAKQREMIEFIESEGMENLKEMQEFYRPPTDTELARARKKLKKVRNPVGLLLVSNEIEGMTFNSELFSYRDILRQTEALLSKRLEG
jgi:hypothetical protein